MKIRCYLTVLVLFFVLLLTVLSGSVVFAQAASEPNSEGRLRVQMDRNYLRPITSEPEGIFGTIFPGLHGDEALHFDYAYTGGVFNNARGGTQTKGATSYLGIFDWGITADTEKLGLWKNGSFYMHSFFSHGRSLSNNDVGDYQNVVVFDYDTPAQVAEYWYEHHFFGETFGVRVGKMDAGTDFFYLDSTENFINSSGTCVPVTGIPTTPSNAWGVMTDVNVTKNLCFKFGLFDADADANQFWMSESGNVYTAYQFDLHYTLFKHLPGFAYIGAWYDNSDVECHRGHQHSGDSGYAVGFEQMIYRTNYLKPDDLRGLTFFAQLGRPKTDRDSDLYRFYSFGWRWLGVFENRPDDVLGFAVFKADFDKDLRASENLPFTSETAYELHYHAHITDNIALQPVFQYVVHPAGTNRNAFVPGLVFMLTF